LNQEKKITVYFVYASHIKDYFYSKDEWKPGGAILAMVSLAEEIAKDPQFNVRFIMPPNTPYKMVDGIELVSADRFLPELPLRVPGAPRWNRGAIKRLLRKERPFIIFTGVAIPEVIANYLEPAQQLGGKYVYWIASDADVDPESLPSRIIPAFYNRLPLVDAVVAETAHQKEKLFENFGMASTLIPSSFSLPSQSAHTKKDSILWVGQSVALKRPWIFLNLARDFPDESFVMIMPRLDGELYDALYQDAASISNLELIPQVDSDRIQVYYDRAKIYVNTSVVEGFPNTFHQAAHARTPILSYKFNSDAILDTVGMGRCADNDYQKLTTLMAEMLNDESMREEMGERGYDWAHSYTVADAAEQYKDLFRALVTN